MRNITLAMLLTFVAGIAGWIGVRYMEHRVERAQLATAIADSEATISNIKHGDHPVFPERMVSRSPTSPRPVVTDAWGGKVRIATDALGALRLIYTAVPHGACTPLVVSVQHERGQDLRGVSIDGLVLTIPVTTAQAASACAAVRNTVEWELK